MKGRRSLRQGGLYHAGGGFKYLFSERAHGLIKGLGLRADARIYFRQGGFELEDGDPLRRFFAGRRQPARGVLIRGS